MNVLLKHGSVENILHISSSKLAWSDSAVKQTTNGKYNQEILWNENALPLIYRDISEI